MGLLQMIVARSQNKKVEKLQELYEGFKNPGWQVSEKEMTDALHNPTAGISSKIVGYEAADCAKVCQKVEFKSLAVVAAGFSSYIFLKQMFSTRFQVKLPGTMDIVQLGILWKLTSINEMLKVQVTQFYPEMMNARFIISGAGGNICTLLLQIWHKLGYIESRSMVHSSFIEDVQRIAAQFIVSYVQKPSPASECTQDWAWSEIMTGIFNHMEMVQVRMNLEEMKVRFSELMDFMPEEMAKEIAKIKKDHGWKQDPELITSIPLAEEMLEEFKKWAHARKMKGRGDKKFMLKRLDQLKIQFFNVSVWI